MKQYACNFLNDILSRVLIHCSSVCTVPMHSLASTVCPPMCIHNGKEHARFFFLSSVFAVRSTRSLAMIATDRYAPHRHKYIWSIFDKWTFLLSLDWRQSRGMSYERERDLMQLKRIPAPESIAWCSIELMSSLKFAKAHTHTHSRGDKCRSIYCTIVGSVEILVGTQQLNL